MTVLEAIQRSTSFLQRKGVDSPRLQAELLLAHQLKRQRMQLYLDFERTLTDAETEGLRQLVVRRGNREPLQQVLGGTSFCGLDLHVNRHVLVPRPETELLAEKAWTFLRSLPETAGSDVLDFGTGSGCLAVSIAVQVPTTRVWATDISPEALATARMNAIRHYVLDRITFVEGEGFSPGIADRQFTLFVSNPPYIPTGEINLLQPEVRDFEPHAALDGGADGLRFYRMIAENARSRIQPGGRLMLEFGDGQEQAIARLLEQQNWVVEEIVDDYTRRPRIVIAKLNAAL